MSICINLEGDGSIPENTTCHLVPCNINHNGKCSVSKFFTPYIREQDDILHCSLRGYPLQGQKIKVPEGYTGVILKENLLLANDENRELKIMGSFENFTYWNWDRKPSVHDKLVKALQWIDVASALHKPVSECNNLEKTECTKPPAKRKYCDSDS